MSRDFGKISTTIWKSRRFKSLRADDLARLLYFYFHTSPHGNSIGCYWIPILYAAADLGCDANGIDRGIDTLCEAGLVDYDRDEELVRIVDFLAPGNSPVANQKHAIGSVKIAMSLPESPLKEAVLRDLAKDQFCREVPEIRLFLRGDTHLEDAEDAGADPPLENGIDTVSKAPPDPIDIQETRDKRPKTLFSSSDDDGEPVAVVSKPKPKPKPETETDLQFNTFWALYPRKVGKRAALKAFKSALKKTDFETLMAGVRRHAAAMNGKETQFIAHPGTWLNGERWADEEPGGPSETPPLSDAESAQIEAQRAAYHQAKLEG